MSLLVLGSSGLLGSALVNACHEVSLDVVGTYYSKEPSFDISLEKLDIRNNDRFEDLLDQYDIDKVVNCAAMTDVDGCEASPEVAMAVNGRAPESLADICATLLGSRLLVGES